MFMLPDWMIEPESVFHPRDRAERALSVRKLFKSWLRERSTVRIMIEVPRDQEAVTRDWLKSGLVFHKGKVLSEGTGDFLIRDEQARKFYLGEGFNL